MNGRQILPKKIKTLLPKQAAYANGRVNYWADQFTSLNSDILNLLPGARPKSNIPTKRPRSGGSSSGSGNSKKHHSDRQIAFGSASTTEVLYLQA